MMTSFSAPEEKRLVMLTVKHLLKDGILNMLTTQKYESFISGPSMPHDCPIYAY